MQEIDVTNSKLIRENIHETGKVKKSKRSSLRGQEHLANERTHQAWMRTAIALMGFGVIILRLRSAQISFVSHPGLGWKLGLFFCLVGWITVLISTRRYFLTRHNIDEDIYHPAHWSVIIFSAIVTLLGIGSIYFICMTCLKPSELMIFE